MKISGTFFFPKGPALTIQEMCFFNSSMISGSFDFANCFRSVCYMQNKVHKREINTQGYKIENKIHILHKFKSLPLFQQEDYPSFNT